MIGLSVKPGKYVLAVSGGVDSMVLLDVLACQPGLELVVAHFDHGIRPDAGEDRKLVQQAAAARGLPFVFAEGKLGPSASEAAARQARYDFLERVRQDHNARAIITAHHQDDVLETAILNIVRGTGRKGLTALASTPLRIRPLLGVPKREILAYAQAHQLVWREDSTNASEQYLRNYIRRQLMPRFDTPARQQLLQRIDEARNINARLDAELADMLAQQPARHELDRARFIILPHAVARELLAAWLREQDVRGFDAKALERATVAAKTFRPGATVPLTGGATLAVHRRVLALVTRER